MQRRNWLLAQPRGTIQLAPNLSESRGTIATMKFLK